MKHPDTNQLIDYIHRELDPQDDAAILLHLDSCDECREQFDRETRLSEALHLYAHESERELPAGVVASIWDNLDRAPEPALGDALRRLLRPVVTLPLAAAAAIAIYFGVASSQHAVADLKIDAAYYLDDHASLTSTVPFGEGTAVPAQLENDRVGNDVIAIDPVTTTADAVR